MLTDAGGADLQAWLRGNLKQYSPGISVTSWAESLSDGMALCALLHSYDPRAMPQFSTLRPEDAQANLELAFSVAKDVYGCPRLLDASDLVEGTGDDDEKADVRSLQTYVLKLRQALRRHAENSLEEAGAKLEALEAEGAALMNGKRATRVWPGALGSEVETSYEAALLSILTYKHTDLMMAAAETEAGAPSPRTRTRHRRRRR